MKYIFLTALLFIGCISFAQQKPLPPDSGFTNKTEAQNIMKNGLKEGKWCEYKVMRKGVGIVITKDTAATWYDLTIYKFGKPFGIRREYYRNGVLKSYIPYTNGLENGTVKEYYPDGKIHWEAIYKDGKTKKKWITSYDESGKEVK